MMTTMTMTQNQLDHYMDRIMARLTDLVLVTLQEAHTVITVHMVVPHPPYMGITGNTKPTLIL